MPNASTAKCTTSEVVAAGQLFKPIKLWLTVASEAESLSINRPAASGGGAAPVTLPVNQESETIVTEPVPFGVKTFARASSIHWPTRSAKPPATHSPLRPCSFSTPARSLRRVPGYTTWVRPATAPRKSRPNCLPASSVTTRTSRSASCPNSRREVRDVQANTAIGYTKNTPVAGGQIEKGEVTAKGLLTRRYCINQQPRCQNPEPSAGIRPRLGSMPSYPLYSRRN